uniref:Uncharacterized protein n=1 Tax=uncultured Thiotrichaceae bacterium TaxID=298394 RepID=A0A6S6ULP7_9GAMM|nr:MAG: Unknown protein [uncultured Thiotrichaceae bacterium]
MKNLVALWKEGWREGIYFIKFAGAFYGGYLLLLILTGIVTELTESSLIFYTMVLLCLVFGFPLIVHWASRISGFRAPTKEEEALEAQRQAEKVYEEIRERNSPKELS